MSQRVGHKGRKIHEVSPEMVAAALERFKRYCRFEPETGCALWIGGTRTGRGHHVPYPNFWFNGLNWHGHRWAAKYIHGQDIEGFQTDHCCPNIPIPNTLCVEHVQSLTPHENRLMQTDRRRRFVHLQVGLLAYDDVYQMDPDPLPLDPDLVPFHIPPSWLGQQGNTNGNCPF